MIYLRKLKLKVCGLYKTNDNTFLNKLKEILSMNSNCIVLVDANINLLNNNNIAKQYLEITANGFNILKKIHSIHSIRIYKHN